MQVMSFVENNSEYIIMPVGEVPRIKKWDEPLHCQIFPQVVRIVQITQSIGVQ